MAIKISLRYASVKLVDRIFHCAWDGKRKLFTNCLRHDPAKHRPQERRESPKRFPSNSALFDRICSLDNNLGVIQDANIVYECRNEAAQKVITPSLFHFELTAFVGQQL